MTGTSHICISWTPIPRYEPLAGPTGSDPLTTKTTASRQHDLDGESHRGRATRARLALGARCLDLRPDDHSHGRLDTPGTRLRLPVGRLLRDSRRRGARLPSRPAHSQPAGAQERDAVARRDRPPTLEASVRPAGLARMNNLRAFGADLTAAQVPQLERATDFILKAPDHVPAVFGRDTEVLWAEGEPLL